MWRSFCHVTDHNLTALSKHFFCPQGKLIEFVFRAFLIDFQKAKILGGGVKRINSSLTHSRSTFPYFFTLLGAGKYKKFVHPTNRFASLHFIKFYDVSAWLTLTQRFWSHISLHRIKVNWCVFSFQLTRYALRVEATGLCIFSPLEIENFTIPRHSKSFLKLHFIHGLQMS